MTTTKMLELVNKDISFFTDDLSNRKVLYFTDNTLNGIPVSTMPYESYLFSHMNSTYEDFIKFVLLCLFFIIGMMVILVIASTVCIFFIRSMF